MRIADNRWLYLANHSGSWGDGLFGLRTVKHMKQKRLSVVYYAEHEYAARLNASLLASEGIIDDVVYIPNILPESELPDFLVRHYGDLRFNRLILGWVYGCNIKDLLSTPMFKDCEVFAIAGHDFYQKQNVDARIWHHVEESTAWDAWSIKKEINCFWKLLDSKKKTVCFMPESTRRLSAAHIEGVRQVADALTPDYNVIILGLERSLYAPSLAGGKINLSSCDVPYMRNHGVFKDCYDAVGWGAIKQAEILKRSDCALITSTGAICLPEMYNIPFVIIYGGNYSIEGLCKYGRATYKTVECLCPLYPCNTGVNPGETKTILEECEHGSPLCLDKNINVSGIKDAIREIIGEKFS